MRLFSKKDVGDVGERLAARHLRRAGYKILARNAHFGKNELDLVVKNKEVIAFVEVKTRSFEGDIPSDARPATAVDMAKRRRTVEAAYAYLREHKCALAPRLDVVEVYLDRNTMKPLKILHIPAAFSAKGELI